MTRRPAVRTRAKWRKNYAAIIAKLDVLRDDIDRLGDDGDYLVFADPHGPDNRNPDQIACYASNSLEGVRSLLTDLWQRVIAQGDPNK